MTGPQVDIPSEVIPDPTERRTVRDALTTLLGKLGGGPWDLKLEASNLAEPPVWVLQIGRPGYLAIHPVPPHRRSGQGVVRTVVECVTIAERNRRAS